MNKKEAVLAKRLKGDAICTWGIAGVMGLVAVSNIFTAISGLANSSSGVAAYTESPALLMGTGVRNILLAVAFGLLGKILSEINKDGRPFTKKNVKMFRAIAIIVICCAAVPMVVSSIAGFFDAQATFHLTFTVQDFWFAVAGANVGIISEIFYYGNELQEDVDLIA